MSAFTSLRLATIAFAVLFAHLLHGAPDQPLRLVAELDGSALPITDLRAGKFVAQDASGWRSVALDAPVRVEGSLEANARFVFWKPGFTVVRPPVRDSIPASGRPWFGYISLSDGSFWGGPVGAQIWTEKLPDPLIVVFAWVLDGRVVHSAARRLPAESVKLGFQIDHIFALSEREAGGFGVALLWSKGRFVAPVPTYKSAEIEAVFHEILFDKTAKLEAALAQGHDSIVGRKRDSLLQHALAAGAAKAVTTLQRHGTQLEQASEMSPLIIAAIDGRTALVEQLLNALPEVREPPSFMYLARWGHDDIARRILARTSASVTISDVSLEEALSHGFADLARELFARVKLDPSRRRQHAHILVRQVQLGYVAAARLFLEHQADPNVLVDGYTPLGEAVRLGETALVEPLLQAGARPDAVDALNNTPLLYACLNGDLAVAERLLKAGANPKFRRKDGQTPLHFAAAHSSPELVNLLLAAGVDPTVSIIHPSPLEIALMTGAAQNATRLAQAGARIDLEWMHHRHSLAAAAWLDVDTVVADALARGWKSESPLEGAWDLATIARLSGSARSLALLTTLSATSQASAPTVVPVAELDAPLKLLNSPSAEDKREGRARNTVKPVVVLSAILNEEGRLLCPRIVRSPEGRLSLSALQTTPRWRYAPPTKNGVPVCSPITVLVSFSPTARDVLDFGEIDTPPVVLTDRWPTASPQPFYNRGRDPKARNNSIWSEDLDIQFVVAKDGGTHSATIANPVTQRAHEYLMSTIRGSRFIPATRDGAPVPSYFYVVIER